MIHYKLNLSFVVFIVEKCFFLALCDNDLNVEYAMKNAMSLFYNLNRLDRIFNTFNQHLNVCFATSKNAS